MRRGIIVLLIAIIVACSYVVAWWAVAPRTMWDSGRKQFSSLMNQAVSAIEHRDLNGAMAVISLNYRDSHGLTYAALRIRAAQVLQTARHIEVPGSLHRLLFRGDTAQAQYYAVVRVDGEEVFRGDLRLELRKEMETTWRYLIFRYRVKEWKIVAIEGYPSELE
jgi:hypothetical protein